MRPLTKEVDETDSPDENLNAVFSASRGSPEEAARAPRPFASPWLREITFRTRFPYSCPPWPGEGASGQRGAFGVIWLHNTNAENDPWITRAWPWTAEATLHLPTASLGYTQVNRRMSQWNLHHN